MGIPNLLPGWTGQNVCIRLKEIAVDRGRVVRVRRPQKELLISGNLKESTSEIIRHGKSISTLPIFSRCRPLGRLCEGISEDDRVRPSQPRQSSRILNFRF